jgi:hypothetical protein
VVVMLARAVNDIGQAGGVEIRGERVSIEECRRRASALAAEYAEARRAAMGRGVALGELLTAVRAQLGRGAWGAFLQRARINMHTANRAMRLAREYGDGAGGIDAERVEARRRERIAAGRIDPVGPLAVKPVAEMSTREVERVIGMRPADRSRPEIRPLEIRPPAFLAGARSVTIGETPDKDPNCDRGHSFPVCTVPDEGIAGRISPDKDPNCDRVNISGATGGGPGLPEAGGTRLGEPCHQEPGRREGTGGTPVPLGMGAGAGASGRQLGLIDHVATLIDELHRDLSEHRVGLDQVAERLRRLLGLIDGRPSHS